MSMQNDLSFLKNAFNIYEYNEQEHMRMEREDAFEDGCKVGLDEGRKVGLNDGLKAGREEERSQLFDLMNKTIIFLPDSPLPEFAVQFW